MKSVRELNGYRLVYEPNHPKAMKSKNWLGYVYEHIIIAEEGLNRSISKTEIVHHLNGDRSDNYPDNLIVIEESQHRKIHAWIERGALYKTEEPNNKHCKVCSKPISRRSSKTYCSIKCSIINTQSMHPHPTCEELKTDVNTMSWAAIGRKYNLSATSIRRRAKKWGLL